MQDQKSDLPDLEDSIRPGKDLKSYIESRLELFSISVAEQVASVASASIQKLVGVLFLSVGAIFLWIALGFFLGELLNSQALGFLLAALPLVIFGAILYKRSSRSLEHKIQAEIIQKVTLKARKSLSDDEKDAKPSTKVNPKKNQL